MKARSSILIFFLAALASLSANAESSLKPDDVEAVVHRYVFGMEKIARRALTETGLGQSEIDRIAADFSARLRECIAKSFSEESETSTNESNKADEACVNEAFENAGIASPFEAP